ncbi:MAG: pyridoxal phosphate-dependent aminotransferase, partial [Bdellovibrionota bacterium]
MLSKRAEHLKPSPTLALAAKAKELQSQGHPVVSLTVGEPDWPTLKVAADAGIEAIQKSITKYTPAGGTIELRKAIVSRMKKELGIEYGPNQISVASGAKYSIFAALQVLCDESSEVIIHTPYWVSYPTMAELSGAKAVIVDCGEKENFKLTAQCFEAAITPKTKVFLFCSPSNPTGLMYTKQELTAFAEVLRKNPHVYVISDDIYNRLVFEKDPSGKETIAPHLLQVAPDLKERVVCINGASKAFSMTGWRIGWAAGPQKIIQSMADYQSQSTGAPCAISQFATLAALEKGDSQVEEVVGKLRDRKTKFFEWMKEVPMMETFEPNGAFYFWVGIQKLTGRFWKETQIKDDRDVSQILLEKFHVAVVPGFECGSPGYLRLSFATDEKSFREAVDRFK